ncbi:MAG TPA: DUF4340 domain-containing protein [Tepidisphaeraceae bacterium]|jgi:hypothetical protein
MNFKTTLVLLVVLIGLGIYIFASGTASKTDDKKSDTEVAAGERKLFDAKPEDIVKITVAPAEGKRMVLDKGATANWKLLEPVNAPAEAMEVDSLARALADLRAHGTIKNASENASSTGLSSPRYKVEFSTRDNKNYLLNIGDKSAVGDNLYVSVGNASSADVVSTGILEQLEKPANSYRNPKLVNLTSTDVKQVTLKRPDSTIVLEKAGPGWRMTQPQQLAAEGSEVEDVVFQLTGLRATDFVAEDLKDAASYQLDNPRVTVTLSPTTQASTQPTTAVAGAAPAATQPVTIKIGRYDDVLRKNVLATSTDTPAVAKVAATIVETLGKKPIQFRDKRVLQINPNDVAGIAILADKPATTQPTTKPAQHKELILKRHQPTLPLGVAAPGAGSATQASTQAATTRPATLAASQPATAPAVAATAPATKPASRWEILTNAGNTEPADDTKIDDLLFQLNPLRADRYLDAKPATTQPAASTFVVKITTQGPGGAAPEQQTLTITDPGPSTTQPTAPYATYKDLTFEVSRSLLEKLDADYKKSAETKPAPTPAEIP